MKSGLQAFMSSVIVASNLYYLDFMTLFWGMLAYSYVFRMIETPQDREYSNNINISNITTQLQKVMCHYIM